MARTLMDVFRTPRLRKKVLLTLLFTFFVLAVYRIGYHVPLVGLDQERFDQVRK